MTVKKKTGGSGKGSDSSPVDSLDDIGSEVLNLMSLSWETEFDFE